MKKMSVKIDRLLWAFMWLLPFLCFFVSYFHLGTEISFLQFVNDNFAFPFIKDIFDNVLQAAFGSSFALTGFMSYLVAVEIVHCLFDVVVFIPRIAHSFVDCAFDFAKGGNKND